MRRITDDEREELRARLDMTDGGGCWRAMRFFAYVVLLPLIAMAIVVPLFQRTSFAWALGFGVTVLLAVLGIIALRRNRASHERLVAEWNALVDRVETVDIVELEVTNVYREQDGALIEAANGEKIFVAPVSLLPQPRKRLTLALARETPLVVSAESEGDEIEPKHEWPLAEPLALEWFEEWRRI